MAKNPDEIHERPKRPAYDERAEHSNEYHREQRASGLKRASRSTCFPGDTDVLTPRGWEAIGGIRAGDLVLSLDRHGGAELNRRAVIRVKVHGPSSIWALRFFGRDQAVRTTESHRFLTQRGWLKTRDLRVGDVTHCIDKHGLIRLHGVEQVEATEIVEPTYNLVTYGDNNFVVAGAVAHNFTYFPAVRSFCANRTYEVAASLRIVTQHGGARARQSRTWRLLAAGLLAVRSRDFSAG